MEPGMHPPHCPHHCSNTYCTYTGIETGRKGTWRPCPCKEEPHRDFPVCGRAATPPGLAASRLWELLGMVNIPRGREHGKRQIAPHSSAPFPWADGKSTWLLGLGQRKKEKLTRTEPTAFSLWTSVSLSVKMRV